MLPELFGQMPTDQVIGIIRRMRLRGKVRSSYHRRRRMGTKRHCVNLLGQRPSARRFVWQVAEFEVRVCVLNGFAVLGICVTKAVG